MTVKPYEWTNDWLKTTLYGGDCLSVDQENKTYKRHFRVPNSDWPKFWAVVLQYAQRVEQDIPRRTRARILGESNIADLFIPHLPAIRRGDRVDTPILGDQRLYSAYVIGQSLHFGINPADRLERIEHDVVRRPDIFTMRGGRMLDQTSWLGFRPEDVPHLIKGIKAHYPYQKELQAIVNYFHARRD